MLNQSGIKKTTYGGPVQILFNVQNQMSVGIRVDKVSLLRQLKIEGK